MSNNERLFKVVTGIICQDKADLLRLWYHESCRVFRDRLVNEEDRTWFDDLMKSVMSEWDTTFKEVVPYEPLLYGDFMNPGSDVKLYELIPEREKVGFIRFFSIFVLLPSFIPLCTTYNMGAVNKSIGCPELSF